MQYNYIRKIQGRRICRMVIKDKNLKLLLETKREFIGKTVAIDSLLSAIAFCISVYFASYGNGFFFLDIV